MDARKNMIILKDEIKTSEIKSCQYNKVTKKMDVEFDSGKKYSYAYSNVEWLKAPRVLNPEYYRISRDGHDFYDVEAIYVFDGIRDAYWHICFGNGSERNYLERELQIVESCLNQREAKHVFQYIKHIAELSDIKNEKSDEVLLAKKFESITFVEKDTALAKYLTPSLLHVKQDVNEEFLIFPFGCNNSQYKAVKNAIENQISVIEGPPGTGKTQTILNIIANILMRGKTVQVVSNNNSATENVYEKLSYPIYNLGFVAAVLGNSENKKAFISQQSGEYPDFLSWILNGNQNDLQESVREKSVRLKEVFDKQEKLAYLKQEQSHLTTEFEYFNYYVQKGNVDVYGVKSKKELSAKQWMELWQEWQIIAEENQKIGILFKIKEFLRYGITDKHFYKQDIVKIIITLQMMYYRVRQAELDKEIGELEKYLQETDKELLDDLCNQSMSILKDKLARKYGNKGKRVVFDEEDLWKKTSKFLEEYPVILSTTFSSRSSLNSNVNYDYLIMDEASQVDVATGALALSCARNVVIVGDTKQLPNVVTEEVEKRADAIFNSFNVNEGYRFTKSFLQSVLDVMPNVTRTMLREHYRCHPKIINFCNRKFYRGELIIMTEDKGEEDVLSVVKTVPGNHARDHYSQRQIDVIKNEIIPKYVTDMGGTGIIAPYKNQVKELEKELDEEFKDINVATVHKFQGREKDTIIISTVDDMISDFADNPYLINVAVSRAKKKLTLVVTGNKQTKERNITDLIDYIQYNNFEVTESKIYSVFDYLYKQYTEVRKAYLQKHKKISKYDSENLMYALIEDVLSEERYSSLEVVCHCQMKMLIKNLELLNQRERQYVTHPATHVDFLLYNGTGKKPILAIEVDGYQYHKTGTEQASRDLLKNHILELYEIPLLRLKTNGSGEREKIVEILNNYC